MSFDLRLFPLTLCILIWSHAASLWAAEAEFTARWSDGSTSRPAQLRDWNDPAAEPRLGDLRLFEPSNPVVSLWRSPVPPSARRGIRVELSGGDRLAGEVLGWSNGLEDPFETMPAYFLVRPLAPAYPPEARHQQTIRVQASHVRRIVWEAMAGETYQPGTVWLRNGGRISFRTCRWSNSTVNLLAATGLKEIPLSDLAEIHLPLDDEWQRFFETAAALTPNGKGRWIRLETTDGSLLTTSTQRLQGRHYGDRNRQADWYQLIQPAWALDPLWMRFPQILSWQTWIVTEPPLSWFYPSEIVYSPAFGKSWPPSWNSSVNGTRLTAGDNHSQNGWGVFGTSQITFQIPDFVESIRTSWGFDPAAQKRGCASATIRVHAGEVVSTLFESGEKSGAESAISTDWISIPTSAGVPRQLVLGTDMQANSSSPGADPLDLRDFTNWMEPQLRLNATAAGEMTSAASYQLISGWSGWNLTGWNQTGRVTATVTVRNQLENWSTKEPRFRSLARLGGEALLLTRRLQLKSTDRWIVIHAAREAETQAPIYCAVRLNGEGVGLATLPKREGAIDPQPVMFPIPALAGQTASCEVVLFTDDKAAEFDFRGVALTPHQPGILPVFDEQAEFASLLTSGEGTARISPDLPYSGQVSLEIRPTDRSGPTLYNQEIPIREHPKLGEFRFITFAWRKIDDDKKSRETIRLMLAHEGRLGNEIAEAALDRLRGRPAVARTGGKPLEDRGMRHGYTYDAGDAKQSAGAPLRVDWSLPRNWQWVSRDLFSDFGSLSLTGFGFATTGETAAYFDSITLARTPDDVTRIRQKLQESKEPPRLPEGIQEIVTQGEDYSRLLKLVAPQFVASSSQGGLHWAKQYAGESDVIRSHPPEANRPFRMFAYITRTGDRPVTLTGKVRAENDRDFKLVILVQGRSIEERIISGKDQWVELNIDLTPYTQDKRPLSVEVRHEGHNWDNESAWWKSLQIQGL
ncbi:hypothetical protein [Planctopirus hydrillae]|uniref:Glycosyl hydrolase family 98 putative carbohydrate-binding module domain-containing protein n=1 Tax=Planctopirus hydrillae TaxID=1841610 RepID=A0A1C3E8U7_9PLAN|nr:hypothetical protein [Planctopirus hydrillae]ODA29654.1 hypothetical protein A6X21_08275 [Planctopirus hydrillae]